jgi:hypothetical protein
LRLNLRSFNDGQQSKWRRWKSAEWSMTVQRETSHSNQPPQMAIDGATFHFENRKNWVFSEFPGGLAGDSGSIQHCRVGNVQTALRGWQVRASWNK